MHEGIPIFMFSVPPLLHSILIKSLISQKLLLFLLFLNLLILLILFVLKVVFQVKSGLSSQKQSVSFEVSLGSVQHLNVVPDYQVSLLPVVLVEKTFDG